MRKFMLSLAIMALTSTPALAQAPARNKQESRATAEILGARERALSEVRARAAEKARFDAQARRYKKYHRADLAKKNHPNPPPTKGRNRKLATATAARLCFEAF